MKRLPKTKKVARMKAAYERQLKRCGFRSWKSANQRRCELIDKTEMTQELAKLQRLLDLYLRYATNDQQGASRRRLKRKLDAITRRLGSED